MFSLVFGYATIGFTFCNMELTVVFFILILIFSIIIHEVSHGYAADFLGDPTARLQGRLTLNPIPHIDLMGSIILPALLVLTPSPFLFGWAKPVPYNPYNLRRGGKWAEAMVAGAGPGVNILLAVIFAIAIRLLYGEVSMAFIQLASVVVVVNILLALFNLIPIPPLDGSKVLKALLPIRQAMAYQRFEEASARFGMFALIATLLLIVLVIGPVFTQFLSFIFTLLTGLPLGFVM